MHQTNFLIRISPEAVNPYLTTMHGVERLVLTSAWLLATTRLARDNTTPDGFNDEMRDSIIIDHAVDELYEHESISSNHLSPERFEQHFEWKSNRFVQSVRAIANVFHRVLFTGIPQGHQLMLDFQDYDKAGYLILTYSVFERPA